MRLGLSSVETGLVRVKKGLYCLASWRQILVDGLAGYQKWLNPYCTRYETLSNKTVEEN